MAPIGSVSREAYASDQKRVWDEISRLRCILEGPPHPGLETTVQTYLTQEQTLKIERDKQHAANRWRLDFIIAILTCLGAYVAFFKH